MEIFTDDWVDVKEMNNKYPNTFDMPTQNELENIIIGDTVKISNGLEVNSRIELEKLSSFKYKFCSVTKYVPISLRWKNKILESSIPYEGSIHDADNFKLSSIKLDLKIPWSVVK